MRTAYLILISYCLFFGSLFSQSQTDSSKINQVISDTSKSIAAKKVSVFSVLFKGKPGKAFAYSLILPGAGQVYNRSYWKVPIIYVGFGLLVYAVRFNSKNYNRFNDAYHQRVDVEKYNSTHDPQISYTDEFKDKLDLAGINSYRQYYDKNLQLSYIGIGILYLMQGIDAFVDRHLQEFDVSKNLSFRYEPSNYSASGQLAFHFSF